MSEVHKVVKAMDDLIAFYKVIKEDIVLLTVKARYGKHFRKEG